MSPQLANSVEEVSLVTPDFKREIMFENNDGIFKRGISENDRRDVRIGNSFFLAAIAPNPPKTTTPTATSTPTASPPLITSR